jgi:hypothetical protein
MLGDFTNGEIRAINRCRLFLQVECLSDVCTADGLTTDPGLQASATGHLTEHDQVVVKGFRVSLVGNMAVHETIHTRLFEQPAPTTLGPWTRPDQRIWPVYYDSSSQMLCQMVQTPQHRSNAPVLLTPLVLPSRDRVHDDS